MTLTERGKVGDWPTFMQPCGSSQSLQREVWKVSEVENIKLKERRRRTKAKVGVLDVVKVGR